MDAPTLTDFLDSLGADPWNAVGPAADWLRDQEGWHWPNVLRHVLEWPDNDGLRLVAARWFEETGEPDRAEFVRVQVQLDQVPPEIRSSPRWDDRRYVIPEPWEGLRRRELELLSEPQNPHTGAVPWMLWDNGITATLQGEDKGVRCKNFGHSHFDNPAVAAITYRCGFVEALTLTAADWLRRANDLTANHPIRKVTLTTMPDVQFRSAPHDQWDNVDNPRVVRFADRDWQPFPKGNSLEDRVVNMLAREWPRITFNLELPAVASEWGGQITPTPTANLQQIQAVLRGFTDADWQVSRAALAATAGLEEFGQAAENLPI